MSLCLILRQTQQQHSDMERGTFKRSRDDVRRESEKMHGERSVGCIGSRWQSHIIYIVRQVVSAGSASRAVRSLECALEALILDLRLTQLHVAFGALFSPNNNG